MIVDITYETPKLKKLQNIAKYEQVTKENMQLIAKEAGTLSDRPSNYNILTDYYNHLISYYAGNPTLMDCFFLFQYSDTLITIFDAINRKTFKGGFIKKPLKDNPNKEEEKLIDNLLYSANENNEDLLEVFKNIEIGANWSNLRTMLLLKEYKRKGREWKTATVKQILNIDPLTVEPIKDKSGRLGYDKSGKKMYFSLYKRNSFTYEEVTNGKPNMQADYRVNTDDGYYYYNRTELIVKKKFPANPIFALKNKILSLIAQDKYVMNEYSEGKPTKKMLLFKGKNINEVKASLKEFSNAVRENPNKLHPLMVGGVEQNMNMTEVVDLVRSMEEMQATEMRNEYRNAIGAPYGVSPIYQNDNKKGGLSSDSKDIEVMNEAIETNKDCYNYLLKLIFNVTLDVQDWSVELMPNEEEDDVAIEELFARKLQNAEKVLALGGEVEFLPDNDDRSYSMVYKQAKLEKKEPSFSPFGNVEDKSEEVAKEKKQKFIQLPKKTATEETLEDFYKQAEKILRNK